MLLLLAARHASRDRPSCFRARVTISINPCSSVTRSFFIRAFSRSFAAKLPLSISAILAIMAILAIHLVPPPSSPLDPPHHDARARVLAPPARLACRRGRLIAWIVPVGLRSCVTTSVNRSGVSSACGTSTAAPPCTIASALRR